MPQLSNNEGLELIRRANAGDEGAFAQFYELYVTPIYRYILVRVKNKAQAEDLTQAVFLKAYQHRKAMAGHGSKPLAYLYTTARNTIIDLWKKKREVHQSDASEVFEKTPDLDNSPDEKVQASDLSRELLAGLSKLTEEQREVISLKYLNDYSTSEIAQQMNRSEEAIRQLQCRALKALRSVMH